MPIFPTTNEVIEPGYVLTYYPGTSDPSTAMPIEVQPGAEFSTIDFTLTQQPLFRVHGRVFDARTGQSPRNVNVSINPKDANAGFVLTPTSMNYNAANGTVLTPKQWLLTVIRDGVVAGLVADIDTAANSARTAIATDMTGNA